RGGAGWGRGFDTVRGAHAGAKAVQNNTRQTRVPGTGRVEDAFRHGGAHVTANDRKVSLRRCYSSSAFSLFVHGPPPPAPPLFRSTWRRHCASPPRSLNPSS